MLVGGIVLYSFVDPSRHVWIPKCPFRLLTGWNCPACGVQRALHALLHGRPAEALAYNYFFIYSIPYTFILVVAEGMKGLGIGERFVLFAQNKVLSTVYMVLFFVWGVLRNVLGI